MIKGENIPSLIEKAKIPSLIEKDENIPSLIEKAKIVDSSGLFQSKIIKKTEEILYTSSQIEEKPLEDVKYENTQEFMKIIESEEIRTLKNNCEALIANHHAINELRIENNSH